MCGPLLPANPVPDTTPITFTAPANIAGSLAPHTSATDTVSAASHVDPTKIAPTPAVIGIVNDAPVCNTLPFILAGAPVNNTPPTVQIQQTCGDTESDILTTNGYSAAWGDGVVDTVSAPTDASHTYASNVTQATITLTATDTSGATGAQASTVSFPFLLGVNAATIVSGASSQTLQLATNGGAITFACINITPTTTAYSCSFTPDPNPNIEDLVINAVAPAGAARPTVHSLRSDSRTLNSERLIRALALFVPMVVFFSALGTRMAPRRSTRTVLMARFLGVLALILAAMLLPSCGGGFGGTVRPPGGTGTAPGTYTLTIQAQEAAGTNYYVVPFTVVPSN